MANSTRTVVVVGGLALALVLLLGAGGDDPDSPKSDDDLDPPDPDAPDPEDPNDPDPRPPWVVPGILDIPDGPDPVPPVNPIPGVIWDPVGPIEPPPVTPTLGELTSDYPGPEQFYQVRLNDTFGGTHSDHSIAYRFLLTAGFIAAKQYGQRPDSEAQAFARKVANSAANRTKAISIIQCSGWNDVLYGTYGWQQGKATPTGTGRAIRLLPQHSDVQGALAKLDQPNRNIALGKPSDKGKGNAYGVDPSERKAFEYLWLPALNLRALWESNGQKVSTEGEAWDDGSSKSLPPRWVQHLGVYVPANVEVTTFGCGLGKWELG